MGKSKKRVCDSDCNNCPIILHPNSKMITKILNQLVDKFGDEAYLIVENNCPNLTVCYDCRIDDFCHVEGCEFLNDDDEEENEEKGDADEL